MTYEPLHHKYRPQSFGELVGQEAIAATLTNAIQQQRIAPAYLFTGARGTGKTSSARILAKSLNCLNSKVPTAKPCGTCEVCQAIARGSALDVIEIDAASNTGVDNIRELIERAQFAPVQCRYKVYIIDEVHMLSTAAFNALLKTLEEPPDRVVFVLATTDPQRVLPTIISRCQRFDYRRIPLDAMVGHLQYIAAQEKISIAAEAVTLVAQIAQGGLRDAESLLDQLSLLAGEISVEQVWNLVGSVPERDLLELLHAIAQDNPESLLDSTRRLMDRGREPLIVLQNLASFYRDLLIAKTAPARHDLVALTPSTWQQLCQLAQTFDLFTILLGQQHLRAAEVQLKHTTQPRLWLEVTLMGLLPSAVTQGEGQEIRQQAAGSRQQVERKGETGNAQESSHEAESLTPPPLPSLTLPTSPSPQPLTPNPAPPTSNSPQEGTSEEHDRAIPETSDLDKIWQDIIRVMTPYSSQVMVRQQCRLKSFDGQQAKIAVSTQQLLKMAQAKLPNIEAAFETVFSRKIHVVLEVSTISIPSNPDPQTSELPPTVPPQTSSPQNAPPNPPPKTPPQSPSREPAKPSLPDSSNISSKPGKADNSALPTHDPLQGSKTWEIEDEVTRAAKNLAEFFAGKVVDLSDEPSEPAVKPSEDESPSIEKPLSTSKTDPWNSKEPEVSAADVEVDEDDDDVPF